MKKANRDYTLFLEDMKESMELIISYIDDMNYETFAIDRKTIDAVVRNFEIIGEASKKIPVEAQIKYPEMPWEEMYRMRNIISHEYFGIDYTLVFDIAIRHLPENLKYLKLMLEKERHRGNENS